MTPRQFEAARSARWQELEDLLARAEGEQGEGDARWDGARLAALYRASCEDLALARARAYPIHLTQRLELVTQRAHRQVYRRHGFGLRQLGRLALVDFPQAVRAQRAYLLLATLLFVVPLVAAAWASWRDPGFILHLLDAGSVEEYEQMYGPGENGFGRVRSADTDWKMFGFYIKHNIGLGFQCFAGGIFAGIGSAVFIVYNGLHIGSTAGYLIGRGHGENFLSFVITHGAFELTAIVLSGAAGLRLGYALIAPGPLTRLQSLKQGAMEAVVVVYGVAAMLLLAAALEAFWSSARWVVPEVKFAVGGACWALVLAYLAWQGRPARAKAGHAG